MTRLVKPRLRVEDLCSEAAEFAVAESDHWDPDLYGVTDGKALGTYMEHRFRKLLEARYELGEASSARGIDFPGIGVDMKVTSFRRP